jgi:hypothetical protein
MGSALVVSAAMARSGVMWRHYFNRSTLTYNQAPTTAATAEAASPANRLRHRRTRLRIPRQERVFGSRRPAWLSSRNRTLAGPQRRTIRKTEGLSL